MIQLAESDADILACFAVMRELRGLDDPQRFLERVRAQARTGYRLAFALRDGTPAAAAGFRIGENLAWGRHLYVDDLVTLPKARSQGLGAALLEWLRDLARREGCGELHLDSGTERVDAHRFYRREGLEVSSYHFKQPIGPGAGPRS